MFRVVSKYVAEVSVLRIVDPEICDLRLVGTKHESPYLFAETLCERKCYRMVNFILRCFATSTRYSRCGFLNTSETIEFSLDFSTGVMVGREIPGIVISSDWRF